MKIAVTGASGFIGSHLVRVLLAAGHDVRATVRDPSDEKKTTHLRALPGAERLELAAAELGRESAFDEAFTGCEGVCHVASPVSLNPRDPVRDVVDPAVNGALNALGSAVRAGTVRRVVLTSSVAAITGWEAEDGLYTEADWNETSTAERSAYPRSKVLAERAAWDFAGEHDLDLVTILPAYVFGPVMTFAHLRSSPAFVYRMVAGKLPLIPALSLPLVDVESVAQAHRLALETPAAHGRYILYSDNRWIREIVELLREKHPDLKLPKHAAPRLLLYVNALFDPEITPYFWRRCLGRVVRFDGSRVEQDLGIRYPSWDETILATAASIRELRGR